MSTQGPLDGVTIIDLTRVLAGPYCTMVLADMGARVIKVEPPGGGDDSRQFGPFINGKSAYFMSINRGKESIALNLKDAQDRALFDAMLARADVVIENYRGGTLERLGYGWERLAQTHPRLIYAAVSGFGHTGPYKTRPAYDLVVQGMGGVMSLTGVPGGPPTRVGTAVGDITAGLFAAIGICGALHERNRTGKGRKLDVSMLDCQVAILENAIARHAATGTVPGPLGTRHPSITPFDAFATRDGHVIIAAGNDALFATLAAVLDRPDLPADPRFSSNDRRNQNVDVLKAEIERTTTGRDTAAWLGLFEAAGVPCGPINSVDQVLADPQVRARNMVITVEDPTAGPLQMAGNPLKFSGVDDPPTRAPAPGLDDSRQKILADLGLADSGPAGPGPAGQPGRETAGDR